MKHLKALDYPTTWTSVVRVVNKSRPKVWARFKSFRTSFSDLFEKCLRARWVYSVNSIAAQANRASRFADEVTFDCRYVYYVIQSHGSRIRQASMVKVQELEHNHLHQDNYILLAFSILSHETAPHDAQVDIQALGERCVSVVARMDRTQSSDRAYILLPCRD